MDKVLCTQSSTLATWCDALQPFQLCAFGILLPILALSRSGVCHARSLSSACNLPLSKSKCLRERERELLQLLHMDTSPPQAVSFQCYCISCAALVARLITVSFKVSLLKVLSVHFGLVLHTLRCCYSHVCYCIHVIPLESVASEEGGWVARCSQQLSNPCTILACRPRVGPLSYVLVLMMMATLPTQRHTCSQSTLC